MVNKIILGDLFFPYQPRQKCGTGALLFMSGVSALTGLGASMYASTEAKEQNADMQNLALNYNEHVRNDEHRIENENYWQRLNDMRSWYADRFNTEQQLVFDNWLRQNNPNTLLPEYAKAGYNMSAMTGASNMAMSPSSTPVVTAQSSPMQSPASIPAAMTPMSNQSQMLTSIGGLIKDLASSSKDSAEVGELLSMLGPKVKNMLLQNDALSLTNDWTKARNQFKDKWWDQEFKNKIAEGNDLYWDAYFKAAQGEYTDEKILTEYLEQEDKYWDIQFDKAKTDEQQERVRQARIETQFWRQRMQAQIRLMGSQANQADSQASYNNALTRTENLLRPYKQQIERAAGYVSQATTLSNIKEAEQKAKQEEWLVTILENRNVGIVLENQDNAVKTAFQRLITGKDMPGDLSTVLNALNKSNWSVK